MTTDCVTTFDFAKRPAVVDHSERAAAVVTAIVFVLLLPAASLLMSVLSA